MTTPTTPPEQRAREFMLKIAHDYEFPAGNRNDIVNELTTLIRKADECDILKLSIMDLSHPNLKMLLNERDSYKAKAEAFDWLEEHRPLLVVNLRYQTGKPNFLSAIQAAQAEDKKWFNDANWFSFHRLGLLPEA